MNECSAFTLATGVHGVFARYPRSGGCEYEIKVGETALVGVANIEQQIAAEEEICVIARFAREIELSRQDRARSGLEPDMIMPGSAWIDTG